MSRDKINVNVPTLKTLNDFVITITGNNVISIENYKKIIDFNENILSVKTSKRILTIKGQNFKLLSYNLYEINIRGEINEISFV